MNKIILLASFCLLHFSSPAQNFLWGRNGCSSNPTQGPYDDESATDMATDQSGNVYVLSYSHDLNANIMGTPINHYGFSDIMVASFAPDGTLRWAKVIGSGSDDLPLAMQTDKSGGVYIAGNMNLSNGGGHIDNDATIPATYQAQIIVKYDINGNYQWYRLPQADTVTAQSWSTTGIIDMNVDANGNIYALAQLAPGIYGGSGGTVVTTLGDYILKYDASGNFKGIINIDLFLEEDNGAYANMALDEANQRFYISGRRELATGHTVRMGTTTVSAGMYVGCFDINGSFIWVKENTLDYGGFQGRALIDNGGNVYLCGAAHAEMPTTPPSPGDNFNGYSVTHGNGNSTPFLVKMDKNGNNIWARDADVNGASFASAISLRNNDEIILAGSYPGYVLWPGSSDTIYNHQPNEAYDVFITRFSASDGSVRGMDQILSTPGNDEFPTRMVSDGNNNVYIGGQFFADMKVNALNYLTSTGGTTDWFVVKYGNMWPDNVNALLVEKDVLMYPNPAHDIIHIDKAGMGTILQLKDMAGRTLQTQSIAEGHHSIDLSQYPVGNYLIQLTDKNGGRVVKKIVKS